MRGAEKDKGQSPHLERMRQAAKQVEPALWDLDLATGEFHASPRLLEIYGFPPDAEITFAQVVEATHPQDRGWEDDLLAGTLRGSIETTIRIEHDQTRDFRWLRLTITTVSSEGPLSVPIAHTAVVEDETERTQAAYALQETEESFRLAIEAGRMAVWEVDLETGTVANSPELNLLFGFPLEARPSFAEFRARYAPGEVERLAREGATLEEVREQFASGKFEVSRGPNPRNERDPTQVQAEVSIVVPGGKTKHLLYRAQYIYSLEGRPKITGLLVDITDRKEAEERITVVARELQHRVQNSLALVQSLARLSLRPENLDSNAVDRFLTRLQALATATNLVLSNANQGANLRDIVEQITRPYRDGTHDPFTIKGPAYKVPAKATSAFSLIIHELCTNAVKYGSLSVMNGTVSLVWEIEPDQSLRFGWKERGGPPVSRPTRTGFGSRLISVLVQGDLKGTVDIDHASEGIEVAIVANV